MNRVLILVEGQTEETFVKRVLSGHLRDSGVFPVPVIVATKRIKSGTKFKGGITSYRRFRRDLSALLADSGAVGVTTMIDYYGLPEDFPGRSTAPPQLRGVERARFLEEALRGDFDDARFVPYLSVHEFEALLLADPEVIGGAVPEVHDLRALEAAVLAAGSPEEVDDGAETHPAARIRSFAPRYRKVLHGPIITQRIGMERLRERCSHFDRWLGWLEAMGDSTSAPGG